MKLTLCFLIAAGTACGQTQSDATLHALLLEVRQLRLALERSAVITPKIQLTLQRMQLQQDQVTRVSRQLEDVRLQMARSTAEQAALATHLKSEESRLADEQDASRRKQLEDSIRRMKAQLEQPSQQQQMQDAQQRARESELESRLQTEQNKLNELSDRLDILERSLDAPPKQP